MKKLLLFGALNIGLSTLGQNVNIPDANFKSYLVGNSSINTNMDSEIQVSEANNFTGDIICINKNIYDLTGIEEFTSLNKLICQDNHLTSLDISNNTVLTQLNCSQNNQLTSLDVSNNTALTVLSCTSNQLTSLDVSNNTALTVLFCINNLLTSLDLTNNTALTDLNCNYNKLTSLDLTNNTALSLLSCNNNLLTCLNVKNGNNSNVTFFDAKYNSNLNCIEVDDVAWSNSNWANIDANTSFSTSCANPCTLGIKELYYTPKELIKIVDLMGRETPFKPNTVLIYVYEDGTTERVFKLEE